MANKVSNTPNNIPMKKRAILLLASFAMTTLIYCQENLQKYEFSVGGNYRTTTNGINVETYKTNIKSNTAKFELGINRAISNTIMIGIAMDYLNRNEQFDYQYYNIDNIFVIEGFPGKKITTIIPSVNVKYVKVLTENFIVGLNLYNGYGFSTSKPYSLTDLKVNFQARVLSNSRTGYKKTISESFYTISIAPEACYYIAKSIGIKLKGELFRFDTIDKTQFFFKRKSNQIIWTLGVSWRI